MASTEPGAKQANDETTGALLRELRTGQIDGFAQRYRDVGPALFAWARLRIPPALRARLDAEDLAQEVCYRALTCYASFDADKGSFRAWLFGIANTILKDCGRQLARLPEQPERPTSGAGVEAMPDEITSVVSRLARDEALGQFVAQVNAMPEDERRLLIYRGLEGLTLQETAYLMGLGLEAVTKRWQRLRERLARGPLPVTLLES